MSFASEDLDVYRLSLDFVQQTEALTKQIECKASRALIEDLGRAALSIPFHIAEGNGRWHKPDKRNFFWIARDSTFECVRLVEILRRRIHLTDSEAQTFKDRLTVIGKILTNVVKVHE